MNNPAKTAISGYQLVGAGRYTMTDPGERGRSSQSNWLLELFTEGCLEINAAGKGWCVRPAGTGVLYPPGLRYWERAPRHGCWRGVCQSVVVFFDAPAESPWSSRFNDCAKPYLIDDSAGVLRQLVETIIYARDSESCGQLLATGCFYQILAILLLAPSEESGLMVREVPPAPADFVSQVHQYMRQHLSESLRLKHIARHFGVSESSLSHNFRRMTGQTPMAVLQRFRIEAAAVYLISNRFTLERIAEQTGFADAYHLSRTFKKITGETPRAYRQRMRNAGR